MSFFTRSLLIVLLSVSLPAMADVSFQSGNCDVRSDYSLTIASTGITFSKTDGVPAKVVLANGSLDVDGQRLALSRADEARIRRIEADIRALAPEIKAIARDGIAIALDAVIQVSASFASDAGAARESAMRIQRSAAELEQYIDSTDTISDVAVESFIGKTVSTLIGELVGNIAAQAVKVAFSGDTKAAAELEARADGIEKSVEKIAEKRGKALEQRAEALCPRLRAIQSLERELDVRLADGKPLRLSRSGD